MSHLYTNLQVAEDWDWSTVALVGGASVGPAIIVAQCQRCKLIKVSAYADVSYRNVSRYYVNCQATLVEPECHG